MLTTAQVIEELMKLKVGRLLCIDWGLKNIGLAISDETQLIATAHATLIHKNKQSTLTALCKDISQWNIQAVIIGLPLHMDGRMSDAAVTVTKFKDELGRAISPVPIFLFDERWTSKAIESHLIQADVSRAKRKSVVDKLAACYLLQGVLEALRTHRR
jgi:putative Holliday junction resolvase